MSVTLPPLQKVTGPEAVIVGAGGRALTVTTTGSEAGLRHPAAFVIRTV